MRVAFYAPMKPPDHPAPSGDRRMARLLIAALKRAGHRVEVASTFRSYDRSGDVRRQQRLAEIGQALAGRLLRRYRRRPAAERPEIWFTYHLYHKAPDWLGPVVARELRIAYTVAEASFAPKQADGPWSAGHAAAGAAISAADRIIALNSADTPCVAPLLTDSARLVPLKPFIDAAPFARAADGRDQHRATLAGAEGIESAVPWLLVVAMMRAGDKLASYQALGRGLARLTDRPWRLLVAGDGPVRVKVEAAFHAVAPRVHWLGEVGESALPGICAAADLFVWPAVNEAYGMVFLEAQAAAVPVVAGRFGGVPDVVADGITGDLVSPGDDAAFAEAIAVMLDDPDRRRAMGRCARDHVLSGHDIDAAARALDAAIRNLEPAAAR